MKPETELAIREFLQTTREPEENHDVVVAATKLADRELRKRLPGVDFRESIEVYESWPYRKLSYMMKGEPPHDRTYGSIIWTGR